MWGLCLCVSGVHRPEGLAEDQSAPRRQREQHHRQHQDAVGTASLGLNPKLSTSPTLAAPTPTDPRGWQIQCSLFGHTFVATPRLSASSLPFTGANSPAGGGGEGGGKLGEADGLPLGGLETHAYLQCGVSRLRRLLCGDGSGNSTAATLSVELLHELERQAAGKDPSGESIRCRCEVGAGVADGSAEFDTTSDTFGLARD